jgi:hypothetical protein
LWPRLLSLRLPRQSFTAGKRPASLARNAGSSAFASAVHLSRAAAETVESPEVVGLMRCNPHGKRQLHVWAEGGYGGERLGPDREEDMPCECAT